MVTFNGKQNKNKNHVKKSKVKLKGYLPSMDKYEWMLIGGLAIIMVYAVVNAAVNNFGYNTSSDYNQELDSTIFADVKKTPLITEITAIKRDGNLTKVEFTVSNQNATLKLENFECSFDGDPWKKCMSPVVIDSGKYDLKAGHTLEIRAVDNQGGIESQPATHLFGHVGK